ncbi:MAG: riboflavin kinase [Candidatus Kerfeldbacteria bacterium]|nr:riboflavin kinase [Candidatus Kerfeldbacteria bacterium]
MENYTTRHTGKRATLKKGRKEIARIRGIVRKGFQRGRLLGYPTANVRLHNRSIREGIYVALVRVDGKLYHGAAFIGAAKTFNLRERKLEVYILDFDKTIYDQWIIVHLLKFLRPNVRFTSVGQLKKAIKHDVIQTRKFFYTREF